MRVRKVLQRNNTVGYSIDLSEQEAFNLVTLDSASLINLAGEIMKVMEQTDDEISYDQKVQ